MRRRKACASVGRRRNLAPGEARRTLVEERRNALTVVGAVAEFALHVALEVELLLQRVAGGCMERALDRRESARRRLRQLGEQSLGRCREIDVIDAFPDETPRDRLLGG